MADQTVLTEAPLYIPIDAATPDGSPVTITVTSSNPDVLLASVITGSQSLRMSVQDRGELVFQLFNQMTPNTSARLIQLTQAGFYDTTVDQTLTFHRVFSNFVIRAEIHQALDPEVQISDRWMMNTT